MRIGIDAGHGGLDENGVYVTAGKRSLIAIDGEWFYEGVNNRIYAKEYARVLENYGHEVVFITDPNDFKDIPNSVRASMANNLNLDLVVSIHSNAARDNKPRGFEVWTARNASSKSNEFADSWIKEMSFRFPELKNRGHRKANFTIIKNTNCPAILLEIEFHSNTEAVRLMRTWEYKLQTAIALAESVKLKK